MSIDQKTKSRLAQHLIKSFRLATVLIGLDRNGLRSELKDNASFAHATPSPTNKKLFAAGEVLGIFRRDLDGTFSWSDEFAECPKDEDQWSVLIHLIEHQLSYLNLVANPNYWSRSNLNPAEQLRTNVDEYERFLRGVAASHHQHAKWFAELPSLRNKNVLIDLGGGLGTFSSAWVDSRPDRKAVLVDLPAVAQMNKSLDSRISFIGADLNDSFDAPSDGELFLMANVIHLLPNWTHLLSRTVGCARPNAIVAVFEANPETPSGILFDLQVHLRSGLVSELISGDVIAQNMASAGLCSIQSIQVSDPHDPFERIYTLWTGEKPT